MDIPPPDTIKFVLLFIGLGLLPSFPTAVRYLVALGMVILGANSVYSGLSNAMFNLPNGDNLAISALFGGSGGMATFNKLSMGVVCGALGTLSLIFGAVVRLVLLKVMRKKESAN